MIHHLVTAVGPEYYYDSGDSTVKASDMLAEFEASGSPTPNIAQNRLMGFLTWLEDVKGWKHVMPLKGRTEDWLGLPTNYAAQPDVD